VECSKLAGVRRATNEAQLGAPEFQLAAPVSLVLFLISFHHLFAK
jgi:hypothetical protein